MKKRSYDNRVVLSSLRLMQEGESASWRGAEGKGITMENATMIKLPIVQLRQPNFLRVSLGWADVERALGDGWQAGRP